MKTTYEYPAGYRVVHVRRPDGKHDIEICSGPARSTGTYSAAECLDLALESLSLALGGPWIRCVVEAV